MVKLFVKKIEIIIKKTQQNKKTKQSSKEISNSEHKSVKSNRIRSCRVFFCDVAMYIVDRREAEDCLYTAFSQSFPSPPYMCINTGSVLWPRKLA